jgi:DNA-binding response OmpR family regulator
MRVLLIEDDSATAQSIELMLKSESFNVYRRISARKASTSVKSTTTTSSFSI